MDCLSLHNFGPLASPSSSPPPPPHSHPPVEPASKPLVEAGGYIRFQDTTSLRVVASVRVTYVLPARRPAAQPAGVGPVHDTDGLAVSQPSRQPARGPRQNCGVPSRVPSTLLGVPLRPEFCKRGGDAPAPAQVSAPQLVTTPVRRVGCRAGAGRDSRITTPRLDARPPGGLAGTGLLPQVSGGCRGCLPGSRLRSESPLLSAAL